jgi:NADH-quinone oxidoreductase subunit J
VVTHTQPVYSALYFVLTVFATAGLFLLLEAEFMAAALILIYAGAILITYVFVIMLAAEATAPADSSGRAPLMGLAEHDAVSREPFATAAIGFTLMGLLLFVIFDKAKPIEPTPILPSGIVTGGTQLLGEYLFKNQIVNLELAGLILTLAMVGAIVIARKKVISTVQYDETPEVIVGPATPVDDNPHSIPVYGTDNPRQKAYPQT